MRPQALALGLYGLFTGAVFAQESNPDYTCTKTKMCKIGCCGPL